MNNPNGRLWICSDSYIFVDLSRFEFLRCANTQPFLCNELGPFQAIFRPFEAILGNFQAILGNLLGPFFQVISGNFTQFRVILRDFGGPQTPPKKKALISKKKAELCTPKISCYGENPDLFKIVRSSCSGFFPGTPFCRPLLQVPNFKQSKTLSLSNRKRGLSHKRDLWVSRFSRISGNGRILLDAVLPHHPCDSSGPLLNQFLLIFAAFSWTI